MAHRVGRHAAAAAGDVGAGATLRRAVPRPHRALRSRPRAAGAARGAATDAHAASGRRLLSRPRLPHRRCAAGARCARSAVALLRRRARRQARARVRAHRRLAGRVVHRRVGLVLGGVARPIERTVARRHPCGVAMNRLALAFAALLFPVLALAALLLFIALGALTPASGEWRHVVQIGPWQRELSVPALIRLATHPLAASLIDGRSIDTSAGRWQLHARSDGRFEADCAPCSLRLRALGSAPLTLARAHLQARRAGADRFDGTLWLGEGAHSVALAWRAHLTANGLVLDAALKDAPAAELVHVFGHDIPEAQRAQVEGRFSLTLHAMLPEGRVQVHPLLDGFAVSGLGTERLLDVQLPAACRSGDAEATIGGWLPRAVIAAEDQRFPEHPGYDLTQMLAVWQSNQGEGATLAGASTLTQQLAKLVYTGDDRSATRKLRELL